MAAATPLLGLVVGLMLVLGLGSGSVAAQKAMPTMLLTLANFEHITSNEVPESCLRAYDAAIPGCSIHDFSDNNPCSPGCMAGLILVQSAVRAACTDIKVPAETLLAQCLLGNAVNILCPIPSPIQPQPAPSAPPPPISTVPSSKSGTSSTEPTLSTLSLSPILPSSSLSPPINPQVPLTSSHRIQTPVPPLSYALPTPSPSSPASQPVLDQGGGGSPIDLVPLRAAARDRRIGTVFAPLVAVAAMLLHMP